MNLKIASVKMMKAYEDYFHVILYTTSTRQVLIFNSWKETLVTDHSNETSCKVAPSCGTYSIIYHAVQDGFNFSPVCKLLLCNDSNKSYLAVLSGGSLCYAMQGGSNLWVRG